MCALTKVISSLIMFLLFSASMPISLRLNDKCQTRKMVPFDFEVFPFDFPFEVEPFAEYEQLYAGERLVWTSKPVIGIYACIKVQEQTVRYGAVCNFLSIKADSEWLIAGWAQYSEGTKHFYIKWQTLEDGFNYIVSSEEPEFGEWAFVVIENYVRDTNQWFASVKDFNFNVLVTFAQAPKEFMAYTKSLYRGNDVFGDFTALCWRDFDFESYHWGNNSAVQIREEYPYAVYVTKPYWEFKTRRNCFHLKGSALCSNAFACLY